MDIIDQINNEQIMFHAHNRGYPNHVYLGAEEMKELLSYLAENGRNSIVEIDMEGKMAIFGLEIHQVEEMSHMNVAW